MLASRTLATCAAALCLVPAAFADVKLPALFTDHMMLQRDSKAAVWGWADPSEAITVTFGTRTAKTNAGPDGRWHLDLGSMPANATPQTLTVAGKNTLTLTDVLVGDVWVCSGQSNMGVQVGETTDADKVLPTTNDPLIRLFRVAGGTSITPLEDVSASSNRGKGWAVSLPESAKIITGVGYFFVRELRRDLNIPIGLIESDAGGTMAQLWTPLEAIEAHPNADPEFKVWLEKRRQTVDAYPSAMEAYKPVKAKFDADMKLWWAAYDTPAWRAVRAQYDIDNDKARAEGKPPLKRPDPPIVRPTPPIAPDGGQYNNYMVGTLFNAQIAPLTPFSIKGIAWYQGESNDKNSPQYGVLFPLMISAWRDHWHEGPIPFVFVQLPNIGKPQTQPVQEKDHWPGMREAQAKALLLPNTAMATTIDVGDPYNVHGKDKYDPGYRLALVTRHAIYGESLVFTGPTYSSMKIRKNVAELSFHNTGSGLIIGSAPWYFTGVLPPVAHELKGFAIAGEDKTWHFASARIEGNKVLVSSPEVSHPVAVRYGWADNPPTNLYNREKLPATPFRTDLW